MKPYRSEALKKSHNRRAFSCGDDALDRYFREQAGQDSQRTGSVVHVLIDAATEKVVGYYTLTNATIRLAEIPPEAAKRLSPYQTLVAVLIGRFAVDQRHQRKGKGTLLLHDVFMRCLEVAETSAWSAIVVDPKNDAARSFYEHHDFSSIVEDKPGRMYILFDTIPKALREAVAQMRALREEVRLLLSTPQK
ncbi:MAG: GNAT family N-acetyltransferase [Dehalococcoidia bacterium]|nr:GNAT family N-acetyltransferase [Dehalococcoidia bacterium]